MPVVVATVLLVCGLSGFAIAQSGSPTPTKVKACAKKKGGALRLSKKKCRRGERRVTWAAKGTQGPAGVPGQAGTPGTNGTNGTHGADGTDGTSTGETFFATRASARTSASPGATAPRSARASPLTCRAAPTCR